MLTMSPWCLESRVTSPYPLGHGFQAAPWRSNIRSLHSPEWRGTSRLHSLAPAPKSMAHRVEATPGCGRCQGDLPPYNLRCCLANPWPGWALRFQRAEQAYLCFQSTWQALSLQSLDLGTSGQMKRSTPTRLTQLLPLRLGQGPQADPQT